jgi:hypothetical protein
MAGGREDGEGDPRYVAEWDRVTSARIGSILRFTSYKMKIGVCRNKEHIGETLPILPLSPRVLDEKVCPT